MTDAVEAIVANEGYPVHPAAECFRLMTEDELDELARDIALNGLRESIKLGQVGEEVWLIDGRNRCAACSLVAGVIPHFETLQFEDEAALRAYVKSCNERRDLTKGQRAMAIAMLYPKPERGRGNSDPSRKETEKVSFSRIKVARQILHHNSDLALAVRDGVLSLDAALDQLREKQDELQSDAAKLADLQAFALDLAELVEEERLDLAEAHATYRQRILEAAAVERNKREGFLRLAEAAYRGATAWAVPDFIADAKERLDDSEFRDALVERLRLDQDAKKNLRALTDGAAALSKMLREVLS